MLGLLYLLLASFVGYNLLRRFLPSIFSISKTYSFFKKPVKLSNWMVTLPASFLVGTLLQTWIVFISAYPFYKTQNPLLYGNIITMVLFSLITVFFIIKNLTSYKTFFKNLTSINESKIGSFISNNIVELCFVFVVTLFWAFFMFRTFSISDGLIQVGPSVTSDFGPHLAVIRSFSYGANIPPEYPHFANGILRETSIGALGNIRYHFFFQFLVGNLEYLGLQLDYAFNIPSILAMVSFLMLFYSFVVILMGHKGVGLLATVLLFFRSSPGFFKFINDATKETGSLGNALKKLQDNAGNLGLTLHEDWGIWTLKVYVNQRHLAFSMGILMLFLIVLLPLLKKMVSALSKIKTQMADEAKLAKKQAKNTEEASENEAQPVPASYFQRYINTFLMNKNAWLPDNIVRAIFLGIVLGLMGFWNGAVVFTALSIIGIMAIFSKHRLEYIIVMALSLLIFLGEVSFFMGSQDSLKNIGPVYIGFLADFPPELRSKLDIAASTHHYMDLLPLLPSALYHICIYFVKLLGLFIPVLIASLFVAPKGSRWLALAFLGPVLVAETVQLTPDITVNHKYIFIAVILLNILIANLLYKMFTKKMITMKIISGVLIVLLTITGIADTIAVYNLDKGKVSISAKDPLIVWAKERTNPNEIFLTHALSLHPLLLSGRKTFYGWPYFTWSAGYDTSTRGMVVNQIYGGTDPEYVKKLVKDNNISYIVIDNEIRSSKDFILNEDLIRATFNSVYNENGVEIFQTH